MPEANTEEVQVPIKRPSPPKDKVARALAYCIIACVIVETSADQIIQFLRALTST